MINIEAIKADREAGTPGDWYSAENGDVLSNYDESFDVVVAKVFGPDIRRIARVPELEDAVIASKEREDALLARVTELEKALVMFASWDHCWPGNINLETACNLARAALAKPADAMIEARLRNRGANVMTKTDRVAALEAESVVAMGIIADLMAQMDWVGTGSDESGDIWRNEYQTRIDALTKPGDAP